MNRACLTAYQHVLHLLNNKVSRADDKIQGTITLSPEVKSNILQLLEHDLIDAQVSLQDNQRVNLRDISNIHNGQIATIKLEGLKPFGSFFIGPSWIKLLEYRQNLISPPEHIYLYDSDQILDRTSNNAKFDNLHKLAWVVEQLKNNSDYQNELDYVFLHHKKVDIPLVCDENILSHSLEINSLKLLVDDEHHKSAKKSLFKTVITEMLSDTKKDKRFEKLISEFEIFSTRFALAFHSYVSDYSFDKIRREFEEKRTEYIKKVNDVFHDIASKLIILPAPLWLALSQSKSVHEGSALDYIQLYKNITIIVITIAVLVIIGIMIWGQFKVLNSVKIEYSNLFNRLQHEFPDVKLDSENELKNLSNRHEIVYWQLFVVQIINMLLGLFAVIVVSQTF